MPDHGNSTPRLIPDPDYCGCGKPAPWTNGREGVCDDCYADGWRAGKEMMAAFEADPLLHVEPDGTVTLKPSGKLYPLTNV